MKAHPLGLDTQEVKSQSSDQAVCADDVDDVDVVFVVTQSACPPTGPRSGNTPDKNPAISISAQPSQPSPAQCAGLTSPLSLGTPGSAAPRLDLNIFRQRTGKYSSPHHLIFKEISFH